MYFQQGAWDGHKWVCIDDLKGAAANATPPAPPACLVYSFGISKDPSFEYAMAKAGCRVYGYDHTVSLRSTSPLFQAFRLGISGARGRETPSLKTLSSLMAANGHGNASTVIHFLKVR